MNRSEAEALTTGTDVFIRATVFGGVTRPMVDSDGFVACRMPYGGGFIARTMHHSSFEGVAPPKPQPLAVGDMTTDGLIIAINGREAWINRRPEGEADHDTYCLRDLTRA